MIPELTCGAALTVVETDRISASAVPARMLVRALCIDAYSTKLAGVIEKRHERRCAAMQCGTLTAKRRCVYAMVNRELMPSRHHG